LYQSEFNPMNEDVPAPIAIEETIVLCFFCFEKFRASVSLSNEKAKNEKWKRMKIKISFFIVVCRENRDVADMP